MRLSQICHAAHDQHGYKHPEHPTSKSPIVNSVFMLYDKDVIQMLILKKKIHFTIFRILWGYKGNGTTALLLFSCIIRHYLRIWYQPLKPNYYILFFFNWLILLYLSEIRYDLHFDCYIASFT
ncbi:hypothetical protein C1645_762579 [Glomus cerebriforme]|uniref:Uncharacterized protein n=1 Tax=Glomus cerebriforme TaxID=658196 RepID=A0A397TAU4_9GLOM|nr:hypothetical protein C1645_762579 [Glomus cerebriforme]